VLGSIVTAIYRSLVGADIPSGIPAPAAAIAGDTLGGAVAVTGRLPSHVGLALLETAREAFTRGVVVAAAISAVLAVTAAVLTMRMLRDVRPT
ncbi:MAG: MFS transporter, partial [Vicinamibacteraceae bacterium]